MGFRIDKEEEEENNVRERERERARTVTPRRKEKKLSFEKGRFCFLQKRQETRQRDARKRLVGTWIHSTLAGSKLHRKISSDPSVIIFLRTGRGVEGGGVILQCDAVQQGPESLTDLSCVGRQRSPLFPRSKL